MNKIVSKVVLIGSSSFLFSFLQSKNILPAPIANAQTCPTPDQVPNVLVTYPSCVGNVCNFTQGSCSWGTVSGTTKNQVTITEVETGTVISDQQVDAATTNLAFPVKESNTYKCDVSAINSCGATGPAGTNSLLCKVDGAVTTSPVPPVSQNNQPLQTPMTLPVTGNTTPLFMLTIGGTFLLIIGVTLFII